MPDQKQTEVQSCELCHQPRRCRRVRKPHRVDGRVIYDYFYLCEPCIYSIEVVGK